MKAFANPPAQMVADAIFALFWAWLFSELLVWWWWPWDWHGKRKALKIKSRDRDWL